MNSIISKCWLNSFFGGGDIRKHHNVTRMNNPPLIWVPNGTPVSGVFRHIPFYWGALTWHKRMGQICSLKEAAKKIIFLMAVGIFSTNEKTSLQFFSSFFLNGKRLASSRRSVRTRKKPWLTKFHWLKLDPDLCRESGLSLCLGPSRDVRVQVIHLNCWLWWDENAFL